jgi:NADH dehydrogenase/NADH:ubiquinone oxidoreductase subunit G
MVKLYINNLDVQVEEGTTILEAAQFLGFPIPTLCYMEDAIRRRAASALWR